MNTYLFFYEYFLHTLLMVTTTVFSVCIIGQEVQVVTAMRLQCQCKVDTMGILVCKKRDLKIVSNHLIKAFKMLWILLGLNQIKFDFIF